METALYLKRSTQAARSEAEVLMGGQEIRSGSLKREQYNRTIKANYQLWSAVRTWLYTHPNPDECADDLGFINRMVLVMSFDLLQLGEVPDPVPVLNLDVNDVATRYGVLYVLRASVVEGSSLANLLPDSPELADLKGFGYYTACGSMNPGHWKQFLLELEERLTTEKDQQSAVVAANGMLRMLCELIGRMVAVGN